MFESMTKQTRAVTVSGLSRGELEGLVAGAGRVIAAMGASRFARGSTSGSAGVALHHFHAVSHPAVRLRSCSNR